MNLIPRKHWTPRYLADRLRLEVFQRRHPGLPWLVDHAVHILDEWLRKDDVVVEFGSGRSTVWLARRVRLVISMEHNPEWYAIVSGKLRSEGLNNVQYHLAAERLDSSKPQVWEYLENPRRYIEPAEASLRASVPSGKADMVLVDGMVRDLTAIWAVEHVRSGGLIVVDNVNRYLPHRTHSPASVGADGAPISPVWCDFDQRTRAWRRVWTTNGVTDTLVMFAPCDR